MIERECDNDVRDMSYQCLWTYWVFFADILMNIGCTASWRLEPDRGGEKDTLLANVVFVVDCLAGV